MPPPTWQIFPTADGHFRWSLAGGELDPPPSETPKTLVSRFPSLADLVRQAPPKLLELGAGGDRTGGAPMFRTGSGRSVSVRETSVQSAKSFLEGGNAVDRGADLAVGGGSGNDNGFPMFQTGSGKSVAVRQASVIKAAAVLGEDTEKGAAIAVEGDNGSDNGFPMFQTGSEKSVMVRQSSVRKAAAVLGEDDMEKGAAAVVQGGNGNDNGVPMFQTGLGKSVTVRESSVLKAAAVLGEDVEKEVLKPPCSNSSNYDVPMFQTGSGKSVLVKQSSISRALSVLQAGDDLETGSFSSGNFADKTCKLIGDRHHTFSNSLFQTGSGKAVNISSAGFYRANTLLGLESKDNLYTSGYFEHPVNQSDSNIATDGATACWNTSSSSITKYNNDAEGALSDKRNSLPISSDFYSSGSQPYKDAVQNLMGSEVCAPDVGQPPLKFHTAGGKSLSISRDALKRARNLLGDSDGGSLQSILKDQSTLLVKDDKVFDETSWNKENIPIACLHRNSTTRNHSAKLPSPLPKVTNQMKSFSSIATGVQDQLKLNGFLSGRNHDNKKISHLQVSSKRVHCVAHAAVDNPVKLPDGRHSFGLGPLVDISNHIRTDYSNMNGFGSEKKRPQRRNSISPFKRPRISRFSAPVNITISFLAADSNKPSTSEKCCPRTSMSAHYPFKVQRKTLQEFFGGPPTKHNQVRQLPDQVQQMNPVNADMYMFSDPAGSDSIGSENFRNMLLHSGASPSTATKEWVANHYKWIVWKLACLERCYPAKASGKFLTMSNALEELKYRYEREVNYGHRSAIKRILDGDSSPASMMVLCISSIYSSPSPDLNKLNNTTNAIEDEKNLYRVDGAERNHVLKIELTDGWYSLDAVLDVLLSKQLAAGKLFIGQKLRIWGASLCGWVGPISPFEASKTVSLLIHINGTYRAHWFDKLGFCKNHGAPLDFRCIKGAGGKVPRTLVGITRIYPVLYKERFTDGGSIVRSERMENKVLQLYNQSNGLWYDRGLINWDGAANMSSEQLASFSTYQLKQEANRQSSMQKKIEKALEDAGLSLRDVTPFMRVRVVSLTSKCSRKRCPPREGIITIWNPTEKQKFDLVEGQIYSVSGLMPLNFGSDILYLQGRGSSTMWKPMLSTSEKFEPFFTPRRPVLVSSLGEVPLASEFDIAAVVVHVGEVYISGCQKKQWIFVTDGSKCSSEVTFEDLYDCLLAVSFCSPVNDNDLSGLLSQCLVGTPVSFCNLVKRARDQMNHLWVAEATENSTYSVCYNLPKSFHLKEAAGSDNHWSNTSSSIMQKLRERILCIVDGQRS
ncbi:uncharacterized protein A4U43_C07F6110 [Asparagus officinalis]|uniref:Tower domain-containing protein n=1 Tax=Asparagus officinalis TaxID=4686 RepID=A0A5P1E9X0_ASPOF|nr:uncharacterized protein A4U43_C07F6110 [Asparagus officinalis]